jgi:beta-lactamase class A
MIDNSQWLELQSGWARQDDWVSLRGGSIRMALPRRVAFNGHELFPMASIAKIAVGMLVAARAANGDFSLDEKIRIDSRLLSPGPARNPIDHLFFWPLDTGRTETLDRLFGFMMHRSDNTSADVLLHKLGGVAVVSAFLDGLGIRGMHFTNVSAASSTTTVYDCLRTDVLISARFSPRFPA